MRGGYLSGVESGEKLMMGGGKLVRGEVMLMRGEENVMRGGGKLMGLPPLLRTFSPPLMVCSRTFCTFVL